MNNLSKKVLLIILIFGIFIVGVSLYHKTVSNNYTQSNKNKRLYNGTRSGEQVQAIKQQETPNTTNVMDNNKLVKKISMRLYDYNNRKKGVLSAKYSDKIKAKRVVIKPICSNGLGCNPSY